VVCEYSSDAFIARVNRATTSLFFAAYGLEVKYQAGIRLGLVSW
jgi:hypothetical protein